MTWPSPPSRLGWRPGCTIACRARTCACRTSGPRPSWTLCVRPRPARHAARQAQLAELLARVPAVPIVLKGAYLAECVYPAPGLRPMNDIDLLLSLKICRQSARLSMSWVMAQRKIPEQGPGITKHTSTFWRAGGPAATPNPYLSSAGSQMVEPHRSLEELWFGLKCDLTPGMWARSQPVEIAGQSARALAPADNFLHLCVHLTYHLIMGRHRSYNWRTWPCSRSGCRSIGMILSVGL